MHAHVVGIRIYYAEKIAFVEDVIDTKDIGPLCIFSFISSSSSSTDSDDKAFLLKITAINKMRVIPKFE